ncbi:MAG: hypothetical protein KDI17_13530 [Halioglobus sp.]|nr:hypothetical protein [Halioglobus sp.]
MKLRTGSCFFAMAGSYHSVSVSVAKRRVSAFFTSQRFCSKENTSKIFKWLFLKGFIFLAQRLLYRSQQTVKTACWTLVRQ